MQILTTASFVDVTRERRGDTVWLIHFFSKSSYGCRELSVDMKALSERLRGLVMVGAVDCDKESLLCERQQVGHTPTMKLLSPASVDVITQRAQLSLAALTKHALSKLPSHVVDVRRDKHVSQFFELCEAQATRGCVLLFTDKYETSALYKRLSSVFHRGILFGEVRGSNLGNGLVKMFKVGRFPTLMYFRNGNAAPAEFDRKTTYKELHSFLRRKSGFQPGQPNRTH